jgi:hypothetical protein
MREGDNLDTVSKNAKVQSGGGAREEGVGAGNHGPSHLEGSHGTSSEGMPGDGRATTHNDKQQLSELRPPPGLEAGLSWMSKLFLGGVVVAGCLAFIRTRRGGYTRGGRGKWYS